MSHYKNPCEYPYEAYVQPCYMEPMLLSFGVTTAEYPCCELKIFDRDQLICECLKYEKNVQRDLQQGNSGVCGGHGEKHSQSAQVCGETAYLQQGQGQDRSVDLMDKAASVLARIKNKSKETGKPLQLYLQIFCQEEFLRRVSLSPYAENLILKGCLFMYTLTNFESRATIDVDFLLRRLPVGMEEMKEIIDVILAVDTGNGFVTFTSQRYEEISPQRKYRGISFQIVGHISNTRTPFNVDVGIGGVIIPQSEKRSIPVQLPEFSTPVVSTYSLEKYDCGKV